MNLFEIVKSVVTVKQAAEHYGCKVNRVDMICCLFHDDWHPSMKLNRDYFYCFGCGVTGDVIDFVARLFGQQWVITPENLEPNPKNPIISSFFRNIGRADRLGSGVRNLYKYSKYYSGAEPTFMEGDVFRIIVPLNDVYSFDFGQNGQSNQSDQLNQSNQTGLTEEEKKLLNWIKINPDMTNALIAESLDWSVSRVKYYVQKLKQANKIKRAGTSRKGYWEVLGEEDNQ